MVGGDMEQVHAAHVYALLAADTAATCIAISKHSLVRHQQCNTAPVALRWHLIPGTSIHVTGSDVRHGQAMKDSQLLKLQPSTVYQVLQLRQCC